LKYENVQLSTFNFITSKTIYQLNNHLLFHPSFGYKNKINFRHARGNLTLEIENSNTMHIQEIKWNKPTTHYYKLNTDATFYSNHISSYGGILHDYQGNMIFSYLGPINANSPLEAEFLAMLIGCRICNQLNIDFQQIILE
jgi:hypothetical protein